MTDLMRQEGAAQAAPSHSTPALAMSTMTVTNLHAGIQLRSFPPGSDLKRLDGCQRLFERVARSAAGRPNVDGLAPDDLFGRRAMVVAAMRGSATLGVAHYHRIPAGMTIRGLAVDPGASGNKLGTALIALALVHGRMVFGDISSIECVIREYADGLNERSRRSFDKLGFRLNAESGVSFLKGTFRDRHLFESAEQDDQGAVFIRHRTMTARSDCFDRARDWLAHWSNAILPITPKRLSR